VLLLYGHAVLDEFGCDSKSTCEQERALIWVNRKRDPGRSGSAFPASGFDFARVKAFPALQQ
jgi:hypothetical protein